MTPQQLQHWQPQASLEQLEQFITQNQTLFQLLEETWHRFNSSMSPDMPSENPSPPKLLSTEIQALDLEILDITEQDEQQFKQIFHRFSDHPRNDRPFGDYPEIHDFDWEITDIT